MRLLNVLNLGMSVYFFIWAFRIGIKMNDLPTGLSYWVQLELSGFVLALCCAGACWFEHYLKLRNEL